MLKLTYKATATFTSEDIKDLAESEPLTYEVWVNRPEGWTEACRDFFEGEGQDAGLALDIVGLSLVSVAQGQERWALNGREGAEALRASIEEQNPDYGDYYIRRLAFAIFDQQLLREEERLGNLPRPLPASENGKRAPEPSTSAAKKA